MVKIEKKTQVKILQIWRSITNKKGGNNATLQRGGSAIYLEGVHTSAANLKRKRREKKGSERKKKERVFPSILQIFAIEFWEYFT